MNERTVDLLNRLSNDERGTLSNTHTAALCMASCRYIELTAVPADETLFKKSLLPVLEPVSKVIPLNLPAVMLFGYQLHQYRHSVMRGYSNVDTGLLFGGSMYLSDAFRAEIYNHDIIRIYNMYVSLLKNLWSTKP